jgi:hypothetical protein
MLCLTGASCDKRVASFVLLDALCACVRKGAISGLDWSPLRNLNHLFCILYICDFLVPSNKLAPDAGSKSTKLVLAAKSCHAIDLQ